MGVDEVGQALQALNTVARTTPPNETREFFRDWCKAKQLDSEDLIERASSIAHQIGEQVGGGPLGLGIAAQAQLEMRIQAQLLTAFMLGWTTRERRSV
jgi:hypothetical protein